MYPYENIHPIKTPAPKAVEFQSKKKIVKDKIASKKMMTVKFVKKGLDQNLAWQIISIQFMKKRNFLSHIKLKTSFASFPIFFWVNKSRFFYTIHFFLEENYFLRSFSNSVARADFSLLKIKGPFHDPMEHTEKSSVHGFSESVKRCFATRKRR